MKSQILRGNPVLIFPEYHTHSTEKTDPPLPAIFAGNNCLKYKPNNNIDQVNTQVCIHIINSQNINNRAG